MTCFLLCCGLVLDVSLQLPLLLLLPPVIYYSLFQHSQGAGVEMNSGM